MEDTSSSNAQACEIDFMRHPTRISSFTMDSSTIGPEEMSKLHEFFRKSDLQATSSQMIAFCDEVIDFERMRGGQNIGSTLLHTGVLIGCAEFLGGLIGRLEATEGFDVDQANSLGQSALYLSIETGKQNCLLVLLEHHANANAVYCRQSPIMRAAELGRFNMMDMLCKHDANRNMSINGESALTILVRRGADVTYLARFIQDGAHSPLDIFRAEELHKELNNGQTLLHACAAGGNKAAMAYVLSQMPPDYINSRDDDGRTPLHMATAPLNLDVVRTTDLDQLALQVDCVRFIFCYNRNDGKNAKIQKDKKGNTPFRSDRVLIRIVDRAFHDAQQDETSGHYTTFLFILIKSLVDTLQDDSEATKNSQSIERFETMRKHCISCCERKVCDFLTKCRKQFEKNEVGSGYEFKIDDDFRFSFLSAPDGSSVADEIIPELKLRYYLECLAYFEHRSNLLLHICGDGYSGKTTLKLALEETLMHTTDLSFYSSWLLGMVTTRIRDLGDEVGRTIGMDVSAFLSRNKRRKFFIYDYGGQKEYHVNHGKFLRDAGNSIYIIVVALWDHKAKKIFSLGDIKTRYLYWLQFINSTAKVDMSECVTIVNFKSKAEVYIKAETAAGRTLSWTSVSLIVDTLLEEQEDWRNNHSRLHLQVPIIIDVQNTADVWAGTKILVQTIIPDVLKNATTVLVPRCVKAVLAEKYPSFADKMAAIVPAVMRVITGSTKPPTSGAWDKPAMTVTEFKQQKILEVLMRSRDELIEAAFAKIMKHELKTISFPSLVGSRDTVEATEQPVRNTYDTVFKNMHAVECEIIYKGLLALHEIFELDADDMPDAHSSLGAQLHPVAPTRTKYVFTNLQWLTSNVLGQIAKKTKQRNDDQDIKFSSPLLTDVDIDTATDCKEFFGEKMALRVSALFQNQIHVLPQILESIGACISVNDDDGCKKWFPTFLGNSTIMTQEIFDEAAMLFNEIRRESCRKVMRRYRPQQNCIFPPGYFGKLKMDVFKLRSVSLLREFENGLILTSDELECACNGQSKIVIACLDSESGPTIRLAVSSYNENGNSKLAWTRSQDVEELVLSTFGKENCVVYCVDPTFSIGKWVGKEMKQDKIWSEWTGEGTQERQGLLFGRDEKGHVVNESAVEPPVPIVAVNDSQEMIHHIAKTVGIIDRKVSIVESQVSNIDFHENSMPYSFIVVDKDTRQMLSAYYPFLASKKDKRSWPIKNGLEFVSYVRGRMSHQLRILFVCPATGKIVKCGVNGNGYKLDVSKVSEGTMKIFAVVADVIISVANATGTAHGCPIMLPSLSKCLYDASAIMSGAAKERVLEIARRTDGVSIDTVLAAVNPEFDRNSEIYRAVAEEEKHTGPLMHWEPLSTGLEKRKDPDGGRSRWLSPEGWKLLGEARDAAAFASNDPLIEPRSDPQEIAAFSRAL